MIGLPKARVSFVLIFFSVGLGAFLSFSGRNKSQGLISPLVAVGQVSARPEISASPPVGAPLDSDADHGGGSLSLLGKVLGQKVIAALPFRGIFDRRGVGSPTPISTESPLPTPEDFGSLVESPTATPTLTAVPLVSLNATVTPTPTPSPSPNPTLAPALTPIPTPTPTVALTGDQLGALAVSRTIINLLILRKYSDLYSLMSDDFRATFPESDFVESFGSSAEVLSGELLGSPRVYGTNYEWAEQLEGLSLKDNSTKQYLLILHREPAVGGQWRLYGTEDS